MQVIAISSAAVTASNATEIWNGHGGPSVSRTVTPPAINSAASFAPRVW